MYTVGKTLWQLWTLKHSTAEDQLPDSIPESVRSIIHDCCVEPIYNTIEELQRKYKCLSLWGCKSPEVELMTQAGQLQEQRFDSEEISNLFLID